MGLLDASYSSVNTKKPRKSDRILPATELNARGLLDAATNVPIAGDALSGVLAAYDAAKGDYGSAAVNALGVLPFVSGMVIPKNVLDESLTKLKQMKDGEKPNAIIKGGLLQTEDQTSKLNQAYADLTGGRQPPYHHSPIDISLKHIYDARVSGKEKPSGKVADSFDPADVVRWMEAAGDDSAKVVTSEGRPALRGTYSDPSTGESYGVRMPISGDFQTGRLWVSGLIPEGKFKKEKP